MVFCLCPRSTSSSPAAGGKPVGEKSDCCVTALKVIGLVIGIAAFTGGLMGVVIAHEVLMLHAPWLATVTGPIGVTGCIVSIAMGAGIIIGLIAITRVDSCRRQPEPEDQEIVGHPEN